MPDVQPDGLSPLPGMKCCQLYLSRVSGDLKAKCDVIRALQPLNGCVFSSVGDKISFDIKFVHVLILSVPH